MAHLFSHKLIEETIKDLIIPNMEEKIGVLQQWTNAINNGSIKKKTESECEQAFNLDIFHKVLGYSFYPNETYTLEAKGGNDISGQKADATLGYFDGTNLTHNISAVQVAVEIKDANTPLDKSQRRDGNLSPVQQGFKYKPQYSQCKWVLVTNFVEIRLYGDTMLDYEIWQMNDLIKPENNYYNFRMFWYLLNSKHLISPIRGESVTERLLSAVRIQTEQITKKFYHEYKTLRLELINDIHNKNEGVSIDVVIQKAQKIIDRIVFVHFCEDFGLLPDGKLAEVVTHSPFGIWKILSLFFEAVNSGSSKLGIPNGYNGGLFHEDKELNELEVGDDICHKFIELGKYDFKEELSVNILGHIFEQSISDLENLRIEMLGTEVEVDQLGESTKSNKRKKDGIFYTPEYIVDYIVQNSLGTYLQEKLTEIEKKYLKNEKQMKDDTYDAKQQDIYLEYQKILSQVKVVDPACGSGAFLVKVFDYLLEENVRVMNVLAGGDTGFIDSYTIAKDILTNNIFGVDLNEESVEITKLSLWLKTAEKGKKLADLDKNIKCGNSLINDPDVAGDKAFDWNIQFADIMKVGGFDVVVGNPPYVLCQPSNTPNETLDYFKDHYSVSSYKIDLFHLFYELGTNLLIKGGKLGFITPNTFLTNKYIKPLREFILQNTYINEVVVFDIGVFESASVDTAIIIYTKGKNKKNLIEAGIMNKSGILEGKSTILQQHWQDDPDYIFNIHGANQKASYNGCVLLGDIASITFGLQTKDKNQYVSEEKKGELWEPCYTGRDICRRNLSHASLFFLNDFKNVKAGGSRDMKIHHSKKIVVRQVGNPEPLFAYDNTGIATLNTMYSIVVNNKEFNEKYVLSILCSSLIKKFWLDNFSDNKQTFPKVKGFQLKQIPIKKIKSSNQAIFAEKGDLMIDLQSSYYKKIDFTLRFIQSKFGIEKLSNKLQKFRELDFAQLIKEIKPKKLDINTEAELMKFFEQEKSEILTLKSEIDSLDREIDEMIFDLYGLTDEEREIVLSS